jgi:hypothetical protein
MRFKLALVVGIGVLAFAVPAWSHHSHANYTTETVDIEGVVTEFHALNPHSWVYVKVTGKSGDAEVWALEGGGARGLNELAKEGKGLKVGDKIKTRCHPLRDGSNGCLLGFIKHPDGTVRDYDDGAKEAQIPNF